MLYRDIRTNFQYSVFFWRKKYLFYLIKLALVLAFRYI